MNLHSLGLLGLIVLKVQLLEILKQVCEYQAPIPAQGMHSSCHRIPQAHHHTAYPVICIDLAHKYIKLGKSKHASTLFSKCANILNVGKVRLLYLLTCRSTDCKMYPGAHGTSGASCIGMPCLFCCPVPKVTYSY